MSAPQPVIIVGGPTASGKSALALDLARRHDGVIINGDSMQLYAELSVITARPSAEDEAVLPHRLYGALPAAKRGTAALWREMALAEVRAAHDQGKVPVVVGGTGMYLRALMDGLADIPPIPEAVRYAARADYTAMGGEAFRARLIAADPASEKLHPSDVTRLTRAWEVLAATGRSLSDWQREAADGAPAGLTFYSVVLDPPRAELYRSCDRRFAAMLKMGALEEVRAFAALNLPADLPACKALGLPELLAHLAGDLTLEQATIKAQQVTRNYAKRQVTWFRHQMTARPLAPPLHACHTISLLYLTEHSDVILRHLDNLLRI